MRLLLLLPILIFLTSAFSQKHDYNWVMGYGGGENSPDRPWFGISELHFADFGKVDTFNNQYASTFFNTLNVSISDKTGTPRWYFNGIHVDNNQWEVMENGDTLNEASETGYILPQGALALPQPGNENEYLLFHQREKAIAGIGPITTHLYYSVIDMTANNGLGKLSLRKQVLIQDTLDFGKLTATLHANGRDWWVVVPEAQHNGIYSILVKPGINFEVYHQQFPGPAYEKGLGQAFFSPDGQYYSIVSLAGTFWDDHYLEVFSFDRCTGTFSNRRRLVIGNSAYSGGGAFSPNSRFLYVSHYRFIYQYDLWAEDLEASKTLVGQYLGLNEVNSLPAWFYLAQLAPDGKIYINCSNGVQLLHKIDYPDRKGVACGVHVKGFPLPTYNAFSLPNFPNYRLGPLDGSLCDTLGIDNIPVANYRADQDTLDFLHFDFVSLSTYEPASWLWDFGDGTTSSDTSPVHTFPAAGIYEVCLTVSNVNGSHTACDTLYLGVVRTDDLLQVEAEINAFPNPVGEQLTLVMNDYYPRRARVIFYDALGVRIHQQRLYQGWNSVQTQHWSQGWYSYEVWDEGIRIGSGKIMRV